MEAAKQGVTVGEDTVSGLSFADDCAGTSETSEGSQKQIEKARGAIVNRTKILVVKMVKYIGFYVHHRSY